MATSTSTRSEIANSLRSREYLLGEIRKTQARRSIEPFAVHTHHEYESGLHHQVWGRYIDRFVSGEIKRLMLFAPPRHGKSEIASRRLPAFILGKNPDAQIIACSYGADLASRTNRDVQRIIDSPKYMELFPETKLSGENVRSSAHGAFLRNSDLFEVVDHRGSYRSAGIGGGITGMGCDFGIIDDPIKNREEANSETFREKLWEWYTSTFYTRLEKDAGVLLMLTRWHEDDLAGRLLQAAASDPEADQWTVVSFDAIAETSPRPEYDQRAIGDPLWPSRYSVERLKKIRAVVGPYDWNALYQQKPSAPEGGILKRFWWRFWHHPSTPLPGVTVRNAGGDLVTCPCEPLPEKFEQVIQSWDMTFKDTKSSDLVAGQVWGKAGANQYCLDGIAERLDFTASIRAVKTMTEKWPSATAKLVEDKANGPAVISSLKSSIVGLIPIEPDGSKESRVFAVSPTIESGNVYLPHPQIAPWVNKFIDRCASFPACDFDDEIDAMTQALRRFSKITKWSFA